MLAISLGSQALSVQAQSELPGAGADADYQTAIRDALQALHEGAFAVAHAQFLRAHELRPSARTLRGLGIAELELDDYVAAYRHLSESLIDPRRPLAELQRKEVHSTLERLRAMIGRYHVEPAPNEASLLVDGTAPPRDADGSVILARGAHTVSASAPGYKPLTQQLMVLGGEQERLVLQLEASVPQVVDTVAAAPTRERAQLPTESIPFEPHRPSPRWQRVWPWVAMGAGASLAIAGTALAWVGMRDTERVEEAKDGTRWRSLEGAYDRAAILTPFGWTLGGVGLAGVAAGAWGWRASARESRTNLAVSGRSVQLERRF